MNFKRETRALFLILLLLSVILSAVLITGGVSHAQAQTDRYLFEITVENSRSGITSVLDVYAPSEKEARDNVVLNGWRILSMKQVTFRDSVPVDIDVPELTASDYQHQTVPPVQPMTDDELIESLLGPSPVVNDSYDIPRVSLSAPENVLVDTILGEARAANAHVVIPASPHPDSRYWEKEKYPVGLPDPENLSLVATVYFHLGIIEPTLSPADISKLAALDNTKKYYLYGHTDNISVGSNASYKDNFELSRLRADAIMALLTENGIKPASIKTVGMGALYPIVENTSSPEGTALNRRVEVYEDRTAD